MASGMETDTVSVGRRKSSTRSKDSRKKTGSPSKIPLTVESEVTFKELQKRRVRVMEKRIQDDISKKKKEFDKEMDKMRDDFLYLYEEEKDWGSEELISDPMILRRRGSMDILDQKKMPTLYSEFFEPVGTRFKLMFDLSEFEQDTVNVNVQSDYVCVTAKKKVLEEDGTVSTKGSIRKVQRPLEISANRFETILTQDGILIIEAPMPSQQSSHFFHRLGNPIQNASPSHSVTSVHSNSSTRSQSPSSPQTPTGPPKMGMPVFTGKPGERRMSLVVDVGEVFKPSDILVQVCNSTMIEIRAKTGEKTPGRMSKNKYFKIVDLAEKIIATSLRAGLMNDGKLVIGALGKPEKGPDGKPIVVPVSEEGSESVVDLAADFTRVMNPEPPPEKDALL